MVTWLAIIAGDSLPTSPPSGHLGHLNPCQKLQLDSSACELVGFSLMDLQMELNMTGQSKVLEQLGHDKTKGSQPLYLKGNPFITDLSDKSIMSIHFLSILPVNTGRTVFKYDSNKKQGIIYDFIIYETTEKLKETRIDCITIKYESSSNLYRIGYYSSIYN